MFKYTHFANLSLTRTGKMKNYITKSHNFARPMCDYAAALAFSKMMVTQLNIDTAKYYFKRRMNRVNPLNKILRKKYSTCSWRSNIIHLILQES